jgi:hypothetical protein
MKNRVESCSAQTKEGNGGASSAKSKSEKVVVAMCVRTKYDRVLRGHGAGPLGNDLLQHTSIARYLLCNITINKIKINNDEKLVSAPRPSLMSQQMRPHMEKRSQKAEQGGPIEETRSYHPQRTCLYLLAMC